MASGVTSAHTAMVGFETTPQRYEQMQVGVEGFWVLEVHT